MMKWKDDAPYALCLSHDVDRIKKQWYHYCYYGLRHPVVQLRSLIQKFSGKEPYWNFEKIIDLEKQYEVRSTFFFLNESHKELSANFLGRYRINKKSVISIIQKLDKEGFDIGLHGSFFSYSNKELLAKEKKILEEIVGHEIVSTRQHHLKFDDGITWQIQRDVGLRYDSTKGYSDKVNMMQPTRIYEGLIEIPLTIMDTMVLNEDAYNDCMKIAHDHGVVVVNFHQCHLNEIEYPLNMTIYKRFLSQAKQDKAWITNMRELGEWLDERLQ